jgi:excinuclease ABC subunit C
VSTGFDYRAFLKNVTQRPGVYQMLDKQGEVLYVGKARNLKKRVSSYFTKSQPNARIAKLVAQICDINLIITASENEALILESNLIKSLHPRYNVLFRDDKSYPYIYLSDHPKFPRLDLFRGSKKPKGKYFGPYPNARAVRNSLQLLQKLFKVRQCKDSFFRNRTRPCLQYQIKRCSAPCVNYIDAEAYQDAVRLTRLFLEGKNQQIIHELIHKMDTAAAQMQYEQAAEYRDQIESLRVAQEQQHINKAAGNIDVVVLLQQGEISCLAFLYIRGGKVLGNKNFFPKLPPELELSQVLSELLAQYYIDTIHSESIPQKIITNIATQEHTWLSSVLSESAGHKVSILHQVRAGHAQWLAMGLENAKQALMRHSADTALIYQRFVALQEALALPQVPSRIECFDISHSQGTSTVASCVVFNNTGALKSAYRRYNISDITQADDYAAIKQAVTRRYLRLKKAQAELPDIILIDGGKGQLSAALQALEELQISDALVIGIAKGVARKPGMEVLWLSDRNQPVKLPAVSPALHLLQEVRDEAHRFAITGHRKQRSKKSHQSVLEQIPGVGAKRRRALLQRFGGLQEIQGASVQEIAKVEGISLALAEKIYLALHE